jgi:hypothetical protein
MRVSVGRSETQISPKFSVYIRSHPNKPELDMTPKLVSTREAARLFGISRPTLKKLRIGHRNTPPALVENVHWVRFSQTFVLFNLALMEDFLANKNNPNAHQITIENYLRSLPSSQS